MIQIKESINTMDKIKHPKAPRIPVNNFIFNTTWDGIRNTIDRHGRHSSWHNTYMGMIHAMRKK